MLKVRLFCKRDYTDSGCFLVPELETIYLCSRKNMIIHK